MEECWRKHSLPYSRALPSAKTHGHPRSASIAAGRRHLQDIMAESSEGGVVRPVAAAHIVMASGSDVSADGMSVDS